MSRGDFASYKCQILKNLEEGIDFSPKGSIDAPICELVDLINSHSSYVTTSSCSGRLSVSYHLDSQNKKGVDWLLVKHGTIFKEEVMTALEGLNTLTIQPTLVYLKCEALILHICCESLDSAKDFHALAMHCGYRESGISISSSNKIMLAIRTSSFSLDMPLAINGRLILSPSDLDLIINEANSVLLNNFARSDKLLIAVKDSLCPLSLSYSNPTSAHLTDIAQLLHRNSSKAFQVALSGHNLLLCTGGKQSLTKPLPILTAYALLQTSSHEAAQSAHSSAIKTHKNTSALSVSLSGESYTVRHEGQVPVGRWGHVWTMLDTSALSCQAFMSGGRDLNQIFSDSYLASITVLEERDDQGRFVLQCVWHLLEVSYDAGLGDAIATLQRFHHAASAVHTHVHDESQIREVCVYGGLCRLDDIVPLPDGHFLHLLIHLSSFTCSVRLVAMLAPLCGHTMVEVGGKCLVVLGGVPREDSKVFDYQANEKGDFLITGRSLPAHPAKPSAAQEPVRCLQCLCHTSTLPYSRGCVLVGGGGVCLSFGPHCCQPVALGVQWGKGGSDSNPDLGAEASRTGKSKQSVKGRSIKAVDKTNESEGLSQETPLPVLLVPRALTKAWKVCLEQHALLSKTHKIFATSSPVAAPPSPLVPVESYLTGRAGSVAAAVLEGQDYMALPLCLPASTGTDEAGLGFLSTVSGLPDTNGVFYTLLPSSSHATSASSSTPLKPQDKRETSLEVMKGLWTKYGLPLAHLPLKFEKVGDMLILPEQTFSSSQGRYLLSRPYLELKETLFIPLCEVWGVRGVAWGRRVHTSPLRHSRTRLLFVKDREPPGPLVAGDGVEEVEEPILDWGEDSWVTVKENHIAFSFNLCKVMFCSGNNTERMRMGSLRIPTEVVVDLYCGIGYYTVPLLVHAQAKCVHACEINPHSVAALKRNLRAHDVTDRCIIHEGDNQLTTHGLQGIAARVLCGLLPSSKGGWNVAVYVLSKDGGVIHIHENVHEKEVTNFAEEARAEIERLSIAAGKGMAVRVGHVERVKSYAPRVLHVVVDLYCTPI